MARAQDVKTPLERGLDALVRIQTEIKIESAILKNERDRLVTQNSDKTNGVIVPSRVTTPLS